MKKFTKKTLTLYENVRIIDKVKEPQEQSVALKSLSRPDTAEKSVQANTQCVGIHLVKIINPMGRYRILSLIKYRILLLPKVGVKVEVETRRDEVRRKH